MNSYNNTILVTGAGSYSAINTIKSLKLIGRYRIIATDIYPQSVGSFRSDSAYVIPQESDSGMYILKLLEICEKEDVSLLIPSIDAEIPYIFKSREKFEKLGVKLLIGNQLLVRIGCDKYALYEYLKSNRLPYLKSFNLDEKKIALDTLTFPIVLKPKSSWGQKGYHLINSKKELNYFISTVTNKSSEYMIQEYVNDDEGEFTNSVAVATDGQILGCICIKRKLVRGASVEMIIDDFPEVKKQMIEIAKKINSPGPVNIQCRLRRGKAMVFEINPRFSTTNIVRAECGFNEVGILVDNFLTGNKTIINEYERKVAMAFLEYALVDVKDIEDYKSLGYTKANAEINNRL